MRLRRVRFTVRMLMVMVAIVALSAFLHETRRRNHETFQRKYGVPLDRNSGRFLVAVKTFRGPSARSHAGALAYEFRQQHGLPSYVMTSSAISRLKPSKKRRVSPGPAAKQVALPMKPSARSRRVSHGPAAEEVMVLIGDCRSLAESQAILDQVRRIQRNKSTSLLDRLRMRAFRTTNPYLPATVATK